MNGNCAFCDRTQFEEQLILEGASFWIIATLGQISDGGYTLLVPKRHVACCGAMQDSEVQEFAFIVEGIYSAISQEYGIAPGIIFEHGIVGQTVKHAHLHLIPGVLSIGEKIRRDFPTNETVTMQSWSEFQSMYAKRQEPYLLWADLSGELKVCWNPNAPLQYLRIVVAEALGRPERANWRTMDPELDKKLWRETVFRLRPYFS